MVTLYKTYKFNDVTKDSFLVNANREVLEGEVRQENGAGPR